MNDEHKEGEKYEAGHEAPEEHGEHEHDEE